MFIDRIQISVKAGDGGNGAISFHREKYVPNGGPDGGDGGKGGSIIFKVNPGDNTLLAFRYHRKFAAENGENGKGGKMHGKSGADLVITVPPGTLLKDPETGKVIYDMAKSDTFVVCKGGRGGWGNRHFATPTRQIPRFAKNGTKGEAREILVRISDVIVKDKANAEESEGEGHRHFDGIWCVPAISKEFKNENNLCFLMI